jgi:hypothetical protein
MVVEISEQNKIMTTNKKIKMLTKTEVYNKMDDNSKRMMDIPAEIRYHIQNGRSITVLLAEFQTCIDKIKPLYQPGGIYHVPTKHKGLRLDNIEDLEEKGKNVI